MNYKLAGERISSLTHGIIHIYNPSNRSKRTIVTPFGSLHKLILTFKLWLQARHSSSIRGWIYVHRRILIYHHLVLGQMWRKQCYCYHLRIHHHKSHILVKNSACKEPLNNHMLLSLSQCIKSDNPLTGSLNVNN